MATFANELRKAMMDGGMAVFNSGSLRVLTAGDAQLAAPTFASTAFGAASTANPSVATAATLTPYNSPTAGTYTKFEMRTSGGANRITGSVGVGSGDIQVTDNTIPGTATSWTIAGLTLAFTLA